MGDFLYRASPWAITLVLHNWPVILYVPLIVWAAADTYLRPTRRRLLVLYGLLVLAFAFEYQKHGVPVARRTTDYLFSLEVNPGPRWASQLVLINIAPAAAHVLGLVLLLLAAAPPIWHSVSRHTSGGRPRRRPDSTAGPAIPSAKCKVQSAK